MRILEKVLALIILLALILEFNLVSGGAVLLFCATLILTIVYYPFGFLLFNHIRLQDVFKKASYKNVTALRIIFAIVIGMGLGSICVGSLYKVLHYIGANEILLSGLIVTALVLIVSLILLFKNKDTNSKFILWRVGIAGVVGIFLMITSDLSLVRFQYRNHPKYIDAYANYLTNPANDELYDKLELERNRMKLTDEEFKKYEESAGD